MPNFVGEETMAAHPNPRCNEQTSEITSLNLRNPYISLVAAINTVVTGITIPNIALRNPSTVVIPGQYALTVFFGKCFDAANCGSSRDIYRDFVSCMGGG